MFFVQCYIAPDKIKGLAELRQSHLRHIERHLPVIRYGGVVQDNAGSFIRICYFLITGSLNEAEHFVKNDPYFPCYKSVEILNFAQRIPKGE